MQMKYDAVGADAWGKHWTATNVMTWTAEVDEFALPVHHHTSTSAIELAF